MEKIVSVKSMIKMAITRSNTLRLSIIKGAWINILDKLGLKSEPIKLKDGMLYVIVENSIFLHAMNMHKNEYIRKINVLLKGEYVIDINYRVGKISITEKFKRGENLNFFEQEEEKEIEYKTKDMSIEENIISNTNKSANYAMIKGLNLSMIGELEKALEEYQNSYKLEPNNLVLLKEMGYIYCEFGDYENGKKYYLKALKLNPKDNEIIRNLATLYYRDHEFSKVYKVIENSYNPNTNYYLKLKGLIEYKNGNFERAKQLFSQIKIYYYDGETYIIYLNTLKKLNSKKEYQEKLRIGKELFKNNKNYILYYSDENLKNNEKLEEVEQILINYISNFGNNNEVLDRLKRIYILQGRYEKVKNCELLKINKNVR